jgi:hypothetical protein
LSEFSAWWELGLSDAGAVARDVAGRKIVVSISFAEKDEGGKERENGDVR